LDGEKERMMKRYTIEERKQKEGRMIDRRREKVRKERRNK